MCSSDDDATSPSDRASSSAAATADAGESPSAEVTEAEPDDATGQSPTASGDDAPEESAFEESPRSRAASSDTAVSDKPSEAAECMTGSGSGGSEACSSSEPDLPSATGDGDGEATPEPISGAAESDGDGCDKSTCSSSSSTEGCARESATAATAKADPSIVVETFAVAAAQTPAEHVAEHNYPVHVRQCGACPFWQHRKACGDWPGTGSPVASNTAETAMVNDDCLEGAAACPSRAFAHMEKSHPWPDFRGCDSEACRQRKAKARRLRLSRRSGGMDTGRCELAASAALPPNKKILELGENSWQRKQQKREAALTACKRSQEYHTWERMHVPLHDVREEPDPKDPRIPKRTWEKQVMQWRNDIRLAAGTMFAIWRVWTLPMCSHQFVPA